MGKSNNRKDMHDFADDYEDYGDYRGIGSGTSLDAEADMGSNMAPAEPEPADAQLKRASGNTAPASTAIKAKMSAQQAKQNAKRSNQTDR